MVRSLFDEQGKLQFWRNAFFAAAKLVLLFAAGLYLSHKTGMTIYMVWAVGMALSVVIVFVYALFKKGWQGKAYLPQWKIVRKLGPAALQHHLLNLVLQVPTQLLPVLVAMMLSARMNAWFYVSWMLANFVFVVPNSITMVLHAMNSADQAFLRQRARMTIGISFAVSLATIGVLFLGANLVLGLFGRIYADQATWCLRILILAAFPATIKSHYISFCRIQDRIVRAMFGMLIGGILELGGTMLGAHLGGLLGLCLGWLAAVMIEGLFMLPLVYKVIRPSKGVLETPFPEHGEEAEPTWLLDTAILAAIPPLRQTTAQSQVRVPMTALREAEPIWLIDTIMQPAIRPALSALTRRPVTPAPHQDEFIRRAETIMQPAITPARSLLTYLPTTPASSENEPIWRTETITPNHGRPVAPLPREDEPVWQAETVMQPAIPTPRDTDPVQLMWQNADGSCSQFQPSYRRNKNADPSEFIDPQAPGMKESRRPDRSLIDTVKTSIVDMDTVRTKSVSASRGFKGPDVMDIILFLLPLLALFLWSISLQTISLNDMNDLGLISALSPRIIAALGILVVSFALTLQRREFRVSLLAFQLICIILILYATPNLIEEAPHFPALYRHAGYTDYIMQTGTVDAYLDIYFDWPGFFVLSAFFTKIFGYSTILSYAGWAPVFFNVIYIGPMYTIFTLISTNKRVVWLSLLFFYLTNWVGQDYFSPQGLNFFLYLVIIMILLKWFRMPPKKQVQLGKDASLVQKFFAWLKAPDPQSPSIGPWQRRGLLCCLILVYGLVVFSHPLTPFFTLLSVFALVIFRRCYPFWLPILMTAMTAAWIFIVAQPYLSQHVNGIISTFGDLAGNVPTSITSGQIVGDPLYQVIAKIRLYMTVLVWFLAFLGGIKRLRQGNRDITYILLAIAGFPLIAAQSYGGEMLMRIYLFTEPFMCFFAAALFFDKSMIMAGKSARMRATLPMRTAAIIAANLILLGSFLFTRYGDERVVYISYDEWSAVQYLYQIAPAKASIFEGWDDAPLYFENYGKYDIKSLKGTFPEAVINTNADEIVQLFENEGNPNLYIIFSQEEQMEATSWNGLPSDALQRLETGLLQTGKFKLIYRNSDAQILQFIGKAGGVS